MFGDERQPGPLISAITLFLRKTADSIRNVLVYYIGHGGYCERNYFIALPCTSRDILELTTLEVRHIARTLGREVPDKRQIIIIDACFAAGAVKDFVYQASGQVLQDIEQQLREHLTKNDIERGTTLFCAAGAKIKAKAPWEAQYTMFSGALRAALTEGDPRSGLFLSLETVADLVEKSIRDAFGGEGPRPELHTPRQEKGDIRTLPLFPNPAAREGGNTFRSHETVAELDRISRWAERSPSTGYFELFELRTETDMFGDALQHYRLRGICGPEEGRIDALHFEFRTPSRLGTIVLDEVIDEHHARALPNLLPPNPEIELALVVDPPATVKAVHAGFTIAGRFLNFFATTSLDAQLRGDEPVAKMTINAPYPVRRLRQIVFFPRGYEPKKMTVKALRRTDIDLQEDAEETARIAPDLFFDKGRGCAILMVKWSFPEHHYVLSWELPSPLDPHWPEVARAREQVWMLLTLGSRERMEAEERLGLIRDTVGKAFFSGDDPSATSNMDLSVLAFDAE